MSRLLDNRYNILQNLAEGGFGTTFLAATRTPSQRPCVVKQLKPVSASPEMQALITQRFTREAAVPKTVAVAKTQPKRPNRWPLFFCIFLAMFAVGGTTWGLLLRSRPPISATATAPELTVETARSTEQASHRTTGRKPLPLDGTSQREAHTFEIILVEGQPQIVNSKFLRVTQVRR
jgi:serine/threonine protein kinase